MGINDLSVNVVPISMLRFIAWKMKELAAIVEEDDVAWVSAMAEEAERRIRERLGLDNNQMLRPTAGTLHNPGKRFPAPSWKACWIAP